MLPLGMWSECFAHTRGGAGAVLGRRPAVGPAGRRCASPPRPAPLAGAASHQLPRWAGDGGGRRGSARRAARPPPSSARRAGGWPAARHDRPAPPRWQGRCPSAQGPAAALCCGGRAGAGGGGGTTGAGAGACATVGRLRGPASAPRLAVALALPVR